MDGRCSHKFVRVQWSNVALSRADGLCALIGRTMLNKSVKGSSIRLGFFLERSSVTCSRWPEVAYRGIDRLPYLPIPEEQERLLSSGRSELAQLWDIYWEASIDGKINVDGRLATELQRRFLAWGITLEVIYGEIVVIPSNLDKYPHGALWSENLNSALVHRHDSHDSLGSRPGNIDFLGFDISHPVPTFHSAISQPGLNDNCPNLPEHLNKNGLFDTLEEALPFLSEANSLDYGLLPFCILGVWGQSSER